MRKDKLSQLFDFQKFEQNEALAFAISSAMNYANSFSSAKELEENELTNVNAAGNFIDRQPENKKDN